MLDSNNIEVMRENIANLTRRLGLVEDAYIKSDYLSNNYISGYEFDNDTTKYGVLFHYDTDNIVYIDGEYNQTSGKNISFIELYLSPGVYYINPGISNLDNLRFTLYSKSIEETSYRLIANITKKTRIVADSTNQIFRVNLAIYPGFNREQTIKPIISRVGMTDEYHKHIPTNVELLTRIEALESALNGDAAFMTTSVGFDATENLRYENEPIIIETMDVENPDE